MKLIQTDEEITVNWVKRFAEYEVSERPGGLSLRRSDTNGGWVDIIDIPQGLIVCGDWDPVVFQYNSGSFASKVAWMGNRPRGAFDGYFCEKARMGTGYNASLHEFDLEQAKVDLKEMQQDHLESYDGENQITFFDGDYGGTPRARFETVTEYIYTGYHEVFAHIVYDHLSNAGRDDCNLSSLGMRPATCLHVAHASLNRAFGHFVSLGVYDEDIA